MPLVSKFQVVVKHFSVNFSCIISVPTALLPTLQCSLNILSLILTLTFLNDSIWNVSNEPWMVLICKNVKHFTLGNFKHFQIMKISIELLKLKILQFPLKKNIKNQPHLERWQRIIALIRICKPTLWRTFSYIHLYTWPWQPDTSFLKDFY